MTARLSLVVPGACGPLPANMGSLDHLDQGLRTLPWWTWLSRADRVAAEPDFHRQLATVFDIQYADAGFPYAALDLLGEDGTPQDKRWLHADPVCLQADVDHAILFDAHSLQLTQAEADKLIAELNVHFAEDGIALFCHSPSSWYLELNHQTNIATHALHDVIGRNVNTFMPTGEDASFWKRFMNEAQMLLHMSEINQQREARGQLPVNSVWLWGEGQLPLAHEDEREATLDRVLTSNACARGLAQLEGIACEALPDSFSALAQPLGHGRHDCVILDGLFSAVSYGDVGVWQAQFLELYETWLSPLIHFAQRAKIPVLIYPCDGSAYQLGPSSRLRLWRRGGIKNHLRLHG
ncbi:MAG: hypothetical protein WBN96_11760 [Gammaproteobacteria bacterium]